MKTDRETIENEVDEEWLAAIAAEWQELTGELWDTRDGECREEGLRANVAALFAKLTAKQPWQPISTAPKGYTQIFLWARGWSIPYAGNWSQSHGLWLMRGAGMTWGRKNQPTHWLPLPEPPHEEGK